MLKLRTLSPNERAINGRKDVDGGQRKPKNEKGEGTKTAGRREERVSHKTYGRQGEKHKEILLHPPPPAVCC